MLEQQAAGVVVGMNHQEVNGVLPNYAQQDVPLPSSVLQARPCGPAVHVQIIFMLNPHL